MKKIITILLTIQLLVLANASANGRDDLAKGNSALDKNEPGPAIGYFTQAIESGDLADAALGDAYWKRAVANFDKNLDDLHIEHSDRIDGFEDCMEDLDSARSYGKAMDAGFYLKSGQCREYAGLKEEAISYYLTVVDMDTTEMNRGLSLYSLGLMYRDTGSADEAELYFGKCASEASPTSRIAKGCQRELQKMTAEAGE
jgi:tetratricopeptide (TPR) repeat protein